MPMDKNTLRDLVTLTRAVRQRDMIDLAGLSRQVDGRLSELDRIWRNQEKELAGSLENAPPAHVARWLEANRERRLDLAGEIVRLQNLQRQARLRLKTSLGREDAAEALQSAERRHKARLKEAMDESVRTMQDLGQSASPPIHPRRT